MHRFEVWAPRAKQVRLEIDGSLLPMQPPLSVEDHGYWRLDVPAAGPGSDYAFAVDDDDRAWPDPRSHWQPNGVHASSRVYDHSRFSWSDKGFQALPLFSAILYEMHIGTFTAEGTLDSAIARLDYLVSLGITHVELLPIAAFPGKCGWGYDGVALYAVNELYGGPDALKRFVDAAHGKGIGVLLDVVYNHFGPVGNYTGKFGPYLVDTHHTPWGGAVNFEDWGSNEVRRFFIDNALMWLRDFHIDGLRLDAVHAFVDRSAIHFLEQLSTEVEALGATIGRRLVLIAESDLNDPRFVTSREAGGLGMDAQWSDDFHHALWSTLTGESSGYYEDFQGIKQLAKTLEKTFAYDGVFSRHRNRTHGKPVGDLSQHRFLGYIQNHDQIGNRAQGDRLAQVAGLDLAKIGAAIVLTAPFVPMLFQGEEWAASSPFQYFADHEDPAMARSVSEGRKREFSAFGWRPEEVPDPESPETFKRSHLHWDELSRSPHAEMLQWYRDLIALRRRTPALNNGEPGNVRVEFDEQAPWLRVTRGGVTLLCNLGNSPVSLPTPENSSLSLASRPVTQDENNVVLESAAVAIFIR